MSKIPEGKVKISINIPERLYEELELDRKKNIQDRSNWMASAIMEKLAISRKEKLR